MHMKVCIQGMWEEIRVFEEGTGYRYSWRAAAFVLTPKMARAH